MKKTYTKPALTLEYFTLTQSIAISCGWKDEDYIGFPTHGEKSTCGWNDGFGGVYWTSTTICKGAEIGYPEDFPVGEVCYNNPNGQPQIFAS